MSFKTYCIVIVLICSITYSCKDDEIRFQSSGLITGPDLAFCACCGGFIINISDSTYRFDNLPSSSTINLATANFPIAVNLDWQNERKCGDFQYIKVDRIEIRNN